jgi:hypothetical protein
MFLHARRRGFGQASGFQLPRAGDVGGQLASGQTLLNQIQEGDWQSLASEGMYFANKLGGSNPVLSAAAGAMSGLLTTGPTALGFGEMAVVDIEAIGASSFGGYQGIAAVFGVSNATVATAGAIASTGGVSLLDQKPLGWHMADYLAFAYPPKTSKRLSTLAKILNQVGPTLYTYGWAKNDVSAKSLTTPGWYATGDACDTGDQPQGCSPIVPVCTPVLWNWTNGNNIQDCAVNLYFGTGGAGGTVSDLRSKWLNSTSVNAGLSQSQILNAAEARAPDPLYWASILYGAYFETGQWDLDPGGSSVTCLWQPDLMNGLATVLGMRCQGASTQSVAMELLLQQLRLKTLGSQPGYSAATMNSPTNVEALAIDAVGMPGTTAGFQQLLDDHLDLAQLENDIAAGVSRPMAGMTLMEQATTKPLPPTPLAVSAPVPASSFTTAGKVALGAGAVLVGGVLLYSAKHRISPVTTVELAYAKVRGGLKGR